MSEDIHEPGSSDRLNGDPGASRNGNFINYYQFHTADERVDQLPRCSSTWRRTISEDRKYVGIDVGCNAGELTLALHDFLEDEVDGRGVSLLGIDLDPILIERALENRENCSRYRDVSYSCVDFMKTNGRDALKEYLSSRGVEFFDVAFCFSITMWIHLNNGDEGLEKFLKNVCEISRLVVVEPQPWKCYRSASRRLKRADVAGFPYELKDLRYRGDMEAIVDEIITNNCGLNKEKIWESTRNKWGRKILIYGTP